MKAIYVREVKAFLDSLIGYLVIGVFLITMGLLFWVFPETSILKYGYASMDDFFELAPYVFLFLVPAITMRLFAEEFKSGMIEILLTRPISLIQLISAKFFAAFTLLCIAVLPTLTYVVSIWMLGNPTGNLDLAGIAGSYIGLLLLGSAFISIGLLASSLTDNQIVSFLIAVFISFIFFSGIYSVSGLVGGGQVALMLENLSLLYHYEALSKGVVELSNVVYLLTITIAGLVMTKFVFIRKRR